MKVRDKNVLIGVMNFGIQKGKTLLSNRARNNVPRIVLPY
jgi:hypothetical protein